MIYNGKEIEFPAILRVSFFKVFEKLEELAKDPDKNVANYAQQLLKEMEPYPELRDGFDDLKLLKKYKDPIRKLSRVLFPDALMTNEIKALSPPFYFEPIYTSTRFDKIMKASGEDFSYHIQDIDEDMFYMYCCYFILGSYYRYPVHGGGHLKLDVLNKDDGLVHSYKMGINADMIEFVPTEKALDITQEDCEELVDNFGNIEIWKKKFPPNSWIMRGISIANLMDTTVDQSMASITSNLLLKTTDSFEKIQTAIRSMFGNHKLEIGVLTLDQMNLVRFKKEGLKSIVVQKDAPVNCETEMCDYTFNRLMKQKEPLVISDVDRFHEKAPGYISQSLKSLNFKSYIIAPIVHEEEILGFMELATDKRYELNSVSVARLNEILPIIAMAHKRFQTEAQNRIEAIIQQECTTIHDSVKWRFEQEAEKFMNSELNNEQSIFKDIIFKDLYPLYGQMDIKGSSSKRNEAVKADLIKQINGVKKVLRSAFQQTQMPAYGELMYRVDNYKSEISKGLSAGSEHKILSFLRSDVYPVFDYLQKSDASLGKMVDAYNAMLDPELKTVYEERKKYDTSVNLINQKLASYLDGKQTEAQEMFPHYFERYKTDGIEYNMYMGQSIARNKNFDLFHLRNLRIWQLIVMCEMENEFKALQKELPVPLEIASLILIYSTPLSVHFRMDEKRFDVEGAYNARYEIIKKRVDKALIKGTNERITQPGNIAIIYSQEQDAAEYRKYLVFLAAKGYLKKGFEDLELEDLQGVSGLRALRAKVAFTEGHTLDELIEVIEKKA
ncbi:GAF domain-containing protein [Fulvivirgaceae bacterium BMA10]|uniref:GAF domain-containing protein n=1 Tax=Splendidivirga corallicola TaxID=3051826 RepID=A0ABT8KNW9_9BACT|nr:GAF domain-containing protein [Fulvivirgaceae bacterium BMA10]